MRPTSLIFFVVFFCLFLQAGSVNAQPAGQWTINVGGGQTSIVMLRSLPNTSNTSLSDVWALKDDFANTDWRTQTALAMRGQMENRTWRGTWHWYGSSSLPEGAFRCREPHIPVGEGAERQTPIWGQFEVEFNADFSSFRGTWHSSCGARRFVNSARQISGNLSANPRPSRVEVIRNGERGGEGAAVDRFLPVKFGRYRTTWGPAIVSRGGAPGELLIMFGGHGNVNYTMSAGRWNGADGLTGSRNVVRGRYFLALFSDVQNWTPEENPPPRCPTRFHLGNRSRWDIGALDAPRWGAFELDFSRTGTSFVAALDWCRNNFSTTSTRPWPNNQTIRGDYVGPAEGGSEVTVATIQTELAQPSLLQRDGPCHSIRALAVMMIGSCRVSLKPQLQVTLTKDVADGVARIFLKPLVDDHRAITEAVRFGRSLPTHAATPDILVPISGSSSRVGDRVNVALPATICARDYWEVLAIDGSGRIFSHNGVVSVDCGPGTPAKGW